MVLDDRRKGGWAELVYRELHIAEDSAGVLVLGNYALLLGDAVFGTRNEELSGTLNTYNREKAERYCQLLSLVGIAQRRRESAANILGDIGAGAAAITAGNAALVLYLDTENYRVCYLKHGDRHIRGALCAREVGMMAEGILDTALEDAYVSFASVEDDLLLYYCDSFKFL